MPAVWASYSIVEALPPPFPPVRRRRRPPTNPSLLSTRANIFFLPYSISLKSHFVRLSSLSVFISSPSFPSTRRLSSPYPPLPPPTSLLFSSLLFSSSLLLRRRLSLGHLFPVIPTSWFAFFLLCVCLLLHIIISYPYDVVHGARGGDGARSPQHGDASQFDSRIDVHVSTEVRVLHVQGE